MISGKLKAISEIEPGVELTYAELSAIVNALARCYGGTKIKKRYESALNKLLPMLVDERGARVVKQ